MELFKNQSIKKRLNQTVTVPALAEYSAVFIMASSFARLNDKDRQNFFKLIALAFLVLSVIKNRGIKNDKAVGSIRYGGQSLFESLERVLAVSAFAVAFARRDSEGLANVRSLRFLSVGTLVVLNYLSNDSEGKMTVRDLLGSGSENSNTPVLVSLPVDGRRKKKRIGRYIFSD